jgi:hypothetical protein
MECDFEYIPVEERFSRFHPIENNDGSWTIKGFGDTPPNTRLFALLMSFRHQVHPLGREYLFWEIADLLWNQDPDDRKFAKHKWSWRIIRHCCEEKFLAVGGAGSSGKSYTLAGWAIVNWLSDPSNTQILITSTDIKGAQKRIWGAIESLFEYIPDPPCKKVSSLGMICYFDGKTQRKDRGIHLITSDKSPSKDRVGKMVGIKAKVIILIADELGEISHNIQSAATGNLMKGASHRFQMVGLSNPASRFDPFGTFSTPKNGWESINSDTDMEWRTKLNGLYIRLCSDDSPNINPEPCEEYENGVTYPYLPTSEDIKEALEILGDDEESARKSREFMRFNKAVFYDGDDDSSFFSEAEFHRSGALSKVELTRSHILAGIDPSFSTGGDKTVMTILEVGYDSSGQYSAQIVEQVYLFEDVTNKVDPRTLQIANRIKEECVRRKIPPENVAVDASGAGGGLCDMLQLQWATGFLRVQFGGAASDKRIKNDSKITGKDRYKNRASELFFIGKQYLTGRQLYGVPPLVAKQMCQRTYDTTRGVKGLVLQVEPKQKYKLRTGHSPDETDSFLVAIELARSRFMYIPSDPVPQRAAGDNIAKWLQPAKRMFSNLDPSALGHSANLVKV